MNKLPHDVPVDTKVRWVLERHIPLSWIVMPEKYVPERLTKLKRMNKTKLDTHPLCALLDILVLPITLYVAI